MPRSPSEGAAQPGSAGGLPAPVQAAWRRSSRRWSLRCRSASARGIGRCPSGRPPAIGEARPRPTRRSAASVVELLRRRCESVESAALLRKGRDQHVVESLPRPVDQLDHCSLAEQRAEQLLVDECRRGRDPDLGPGQAGRVDERRQHHADADRVDADRCAAREAPLALAGLRDVRSRSKRSTRRGARGNDRRSLRMGPHSVAILVDGFRDRAILGPGGHRAAGRFGRMEPNAASRSSVVASRISATGARAGRKMLAIAPRTTPMPREKIRVTSSAPT